MIFQSYTFRIVALGAILIGFIAGMLSVFFISRRQSLLADAISHSTLAGITLSYLVLAEATRLGLLAGALVTGLLSVVLISVITRYSVIKSDAAIGIVLSLLFGLGIVLLSIIQQSDTSAQSGLKHYLFGNIAYLRLSDIPTILLLGLFVVGTLGLLWKELKLLSFDSEFAKTLGLPVGRYEVLLLILVVTTVIIGVELIGVVMMAGLLIAPGIAARQWSNVFGRVVFISAGFGAIAGLLGAMASASISNLPAGPGIIVILGGIVLVSLIFSQDGWLWHTLRLARYRLQYDVVESLEHLATHMLINPRDCDIREFAVTEIHSQTDKIHAKNHRLYDDLDLLEELGYIHPREGGTWILTHKGMEMVEDMKGKLPAFSKEEVTL